MGREVRRVPAGWEHPKDDQGRYIPLSNEFPYDAEEIAEGLRDGWLDNKPPHYGCNIMPQWKDEERTHWQMYEDTSEGTPISPVFDCPKKLARWLADTGASAFADRTATYDQWLATVERGYAISAMMSSTTGLVSGVEALAAHEASEKARN